jgi:hypothetical protein
MMDVCVRNLIPESFSSLKCIQGGSGYINYKEQINSIFNLYTSYFFINIMNISNHFGKRGKKEGNGL